MDINLDGNSDLSIKQRMYLDIIAPNNFTYDNYPYCLLEFKNGLEFSTKIESYVQGQGSVGKIIGIDTLSYKNRIDNISEWSCNITKAVMWHDTNSTYRITNGYWFYLTNAEKYIGIRMKINSHYKFGWIKVNEFSRENISFVSYALEK